MAKFFQKENHAPPLDPGPGIAPPPPDSLVKRYIFKLGVSFAGLPLSFLAQALIPRILGPTAYGEFNFLSNFFMQIIAFFDAGISSAFYSKLSHRPHDKGLIRYFTFAALGISSLAAGFVAIVFILRLSGILWPDQENIYIWMALVFGLFTWYSQIINKILDAYGLTVVSETVRLAQRVLGVALLVGLFFAGIHSLKFYFFYQYVILAFLGLAWCLALLRKGISIFPDTKISPAQARSYTAEFYTYSAPLIIFGIFSLLEGVADRWMLQRFAGSIQQGFYGLSYQIGALCFLFSGAMTPLFWREISKSFGEKDEVRMKLLFSRTLPLLYFITAYISVFVMAQAGKVTQILGGNAFEQAVLPIAIMALYPIHQTYGQLTGTFLLGTGQTRLYRDIGIVLLTIGLAFAYWMLAPKNMFGLDLGAIGLALKMVVIQFISVNVQLWYITRYLKLSFWRFFYNQLIILISLTSLAWACTSATNLLINNTVLALIISGLLYTLVSALLLYCFPSLLSLSRKEFTSQIAGTLRWLNLTKLLRGGNNGTAAP